MRRKAIVRGWLLAILLTPTVTAGVPGGLESRLGAVLSRLPEGVTAAVLVEDHERKTWFARNETRPMKPASVMKLFTTAAALDHLGADFHYETRFFFENGELWAVGGGDPALGDERLAKQRGESRDALFDRLANELKNRSVTSLQKIVLDDAVFDDQSRHADWPADQADRWYQAPVGGLNYNDNCLDAKAVAKNGRVTLQLWPTLPMTFVENGLKPAKRNTAGLRRGLDSDIFVLKGGVKDQMKLAPAAAGRPTVFFGHALKEALARRGVPTVGDVVRRQIGKEAIARAKPVFVARTSLREVLWRTNTFSQNLFAECLLKSMAAYAPRGRRSESAGTWAEGSNRVRGVLDDHGVSMAGAVLRDGSGLSHQNRVSARQVVDLLHVMSQHPHRNLFRDSLSTAGVEGTLRSAYNRPGLRNRLIGKTGTISGVRALAGYLTLSDDQEVVFAILLHGNGVSRDQVRSIVESLAGSPVSE